MDRKYSYPQYSARLDDKNIVILELGRKYTKCGFAGESAPRAIVPTCVKDELRSQTSLYLHDITDVTKLQDHLGVFIEKIYFDQLAVSPKEKKLVVVESVFCRSLFRTTLTRVLFEKFQVPSVLFVPGHLMALATFGLSTGLIVDIGFVEAVSIGVVNGVTLLDGTQFAALGAKTLDSLIHTELVNSNNNFKHVLEPHIIEDIRIKSCFVAPFERGQIMTQSKLTKSKQIHQEAIRMANQDNKCVDLSSMDVCYFLPNPDEHSPAEASYYHGGWDCIKIPGNLREGACEIMFEIFGEEHSLTTMIVETILMAPVDCRRALAENIIIIGGLANLPGLEHRLLKELENVGKYNRFPVEVRSPMKIHRPICPRNYVSWLGASVFCTASFVDNESTTRDSWITGGQKNLSGDWSDFRWAEKNKAVIKAK